MNAEFFDGPDGLRLRLRPDENTMTDRLATDEDKATHRSAYSAYLAANPKSEPKPEPKPEQPEPQPDDGSGGSLDEQAERRRVRRNRDA